MKKSEFFVKSKKINLGFLVFVLVFYLSQPAFAISGDHQWQRVDETKYVDKYFEIDKNNGFQLHIFLPNGQKIGTVDNNGNINYQVNDYLGSPTIITNEQGQIVETNNYGDYGDIVNQNSSIDNNYKFTGKEQDSETNLQYFGARYYDNEAGRFVSIDPFTQKLQGLNYEKLSVFLADPQRLNSYSYASNDPINKIDFDGNLTMRACLILSRPLLN